MKDAVEGSESATVFLWSAEIQMIFIDHNHRYLGKEYVVVRSCVFAFVIRRFNIYCVEVKPL